MTTPSMREPRAGVSYSEALAAAYASAPESEVILDTLEFQHPTFLDESGHPMAVRVVNDAIDFVGTLEADALMNPGAAVTFTACYFQFSRPEESDSTSMPEVHLQVDNVSMLLMPYLEAAMSSRVPITMIWRPYLASDPSGPHMLPVLTLTLRAMEAAIDSIQATAGFVDLSNQRFPGNEYKASEYPGLTVR